MEELSLEELLVRYNFIIPEIQREYVWGNNESQILDKFFNDLRNQNQTFGTNSNRLFEELKRKIEEITTKEFQIGINKEIERVLIDFESSSSINIGFLYSYRPGYYIHNDSADDVFLIDGQQRFTTLFLSLLYFALKEELPTSSTNLKERFLELFKVDLEKGQLAFDYRVRQVTHNFLIDLIGNTNSISQLVDVSNQTWYLKIYEQDVTVKAMLKTITKLNENFGKDKSLYFDFLSKKVKFWHFKTEETSQGEELYITMNSRGKSLSDNEILRAQLFEKIEDKAKLLEWGKKWETWQDFFWNNKETNGTADIGFNEFLRWVQILNMVQKTNIDTQNDDDNSTDKRRITETIKWERKDYRQLDSAFITLESIDSYFEALTCIYVSLPGDLIGIKGKYPNYFRGNIILTQWLKPSKRILQDGATVHTITQNESFRLLPLLEYCKMRLDFGEGVDSQYLYRFASFLFNLSKQSTVTKGINAACINAIKLAGAFSEMSDDVAEIVNLNRASVTLLPPEEKIKFQLYRSRSKSLDREALEQAFWKAEDLRLNNGRIGHLIQASYFVNGAIDNYSYDYNFRNCVESDFNLSNFQSLLDKYIHINDGCNQTSISERLWGNLIITPFYNQYPYGPHKVISCSYSDEFALRSKEFLKIVLDTDLSVSSGENLGNRESNFFKIYQDVDSIKNETDLKKQIFTHFVILFKRDGAFFRNKGKNFGVYENVNYVSTFFSTKNHFEHYVERWGGAEWRYLYTDAAEGNCLSNLLDGSFWH